MPPHSSHLTQPLNIDVFSPLKSNLIAELDRYIYIRTPRIQKVERLIAFIKALAQAFTIQNICSGWSDTDLFPFNPETVVRHVPILPFVDPAARLPTL